MVNDTTTLNGALSELGETMAANITTKGVSASASDGLTTLAGKILQISGDTPTPTVLFQDDCSTDKTSQYGSAVCLDGKSTTESLTFSTDHYIMSGSGEGFAGFIIPNVNQDNVKVRIKFKLTQTSSAAYNQFGIGVGNVGAVTTNQGLRVRNDKLFQQFNFTNGSESEGNVYTHSTNYSGEWFYVELIKEGTEITIKLYDDSLNQLATNTRTINDYSNPQYIFYNLSVRGTSYSTLIQEILVETLGSGSDCSQYTTQINNAITYINGSGS